MKTKMIYTAALIAGLFVCSMASAHMVDLFGSGYLTARGHGSAVILGSGTAVVKGNGTLIVNENAQIVSHRLGERVDLPGGYTMFIGFDGIAVLRGDDMDIALFGSNVELGASGEGRVILQGCGTYEHGNGGGEWSPDGVEIELAQ